MPQGNPLEYAVQAEANLEKLATELATLGAPEETVKAVSQMAEVVRKIVTALGKGQASTGDDEPPEQDQPPEPPPEDRPQSIGGATDQLYEETRRNARER